MAKEQPEFLREVEQILRREEHVKYRWEESKGTWEIPVSAKTREYFLSVLGEVLESDDSELREAAKAVEKQIARGKMKLLQAPEIILDEDGSRQYVQLGVGIYLWDDEDPSIIPKKQIIAAIMVEGQIIRDAEHRKRKK